MSEIETVEVKTIKLSNGVEMPMIGLGTFRVIFRAIFNKFRLFKSQEIL